MSPAMVEVSPFSGGFPRVSGDEPTVETMFHTVLMFSPRERG